MAFESDDFEKAFKSGSDEPKKGFSLKNLSKKEIVWISFISLLVLGSASLIFIGEGPAPDEGNRTVELVFEETDCAQIDGENFINIVAKNKMDESFSLRNVSSIYVDGVNVKGLLGGSLGAGEKATILTYDCSLSAIGFCGGGSHLIEINFQNSTQSTYVNCMNVGIGSFCGDGILDEGEECDDGNSINNDGCSSVCLNESEPPEPGHNFTFIKDEGQLIWMHPNSQGWSELKRNRPGLWDTTLEKIDGLGVFGGNNIKNSNQETVNEALDMLISRQIRFQVEVGGLRPHACTGVEGFAIDEPLFEKIEIAGYQNLNGVVVRLDAPYTFTAETAYHNNPCLHSLDNVAYEMVQYMKITQEEFPEVEFVWNEPIGLFSFDDITSNNAEVTVADLEVIIPMVFDEAEAQGVRLSGFTSDNSLSPVVNQPQGRGWEKHRRLSEFVRGLGKRYDVLINWAGERCPDAPNGNIATNEEFYLGTLGYYDCMMYNNVVLDDIYPESWWYHPDASVPEEEPFTFANLMLGFFDRVEDQNYVPNCDFIRDVFIPEGWGTHPMDSCEVGGR